MKEEKTKVGELYAMINQKTKEIGGDLLPSEIILGSMVEVLKSVDYVESPDGRKAIVFSDTAAMAFVSVLDNMESIYESARFKEFGRLCKNKVEASGGLSDSYKAFRKAMNGNDESGAIGFGR